MSFDPYKWGHKHCVLFLRLIWNIPPYINKPTISRLAAVLDLRVEWSKTFFSSQTLEQCYVLGREITHNQHFHKRSFHSKACMPTRAMIRYWGSKKAPDNISNFR